MRKENLRQVARELGYEEVSTVISSGNIVFASESTDPAGIEASFEAAWPERLGFESTTIVRSRAELAALVDLRPFGELVHKPETYLLATFSKEELSVPLELPQRPDGFEHDVVAATEREIFTVTDTTTEKTPNVMGWLEKLFGKSISSRTWQTVRRILERMDQPQPGASHPGGGIAIQLCSVIMGSI